MPRKAKNLAFFAWKHRETDLIFRAFYMSQDVYTQNKISANSVVIISQ